MTRIVPADLMRDGHRERVRTLQVSVGNGRHHGGGMTVAADAEPDDRLRHVYSLEIRHWWRLPLLLPASRRGDQAAWPGFRSFSCRDLTLDTPDPMPEIAGGSPATFGVRPRAVTVWARCCWWGNRRRQHPSRRFGSDVSFDELPLLANLQRRAFNVKRTTL